MPDSYDSSHFLPRGALALFSSLRSDFALISMLVKKDLAIRYRGQILGLFWTFINPLTVSLVLFLVFSQLFQTSDVDGIPYFIFVLSGIICLNFFSQSVFNAADSISTKKSIFSKLRVNPFSVISSQMISQTIHLCAGILVITVIYAPIGWNPSWMIFFLPIWLFMFILFSMSISLTFGLLFIRYLDFRNVFQLLILILTYLTPFIYPIAILENRIRMVVNHNPLTAYTEILRGLMFSNHPIIWSDYFYVFPLTILLFLVSIKFFSSNWSKVVKSL